MTNKVCCVYTYIKFIYISDSNHTITSGAYEALIAETIPVFLDSDSTYDDLVNEVLFEDPTSGQQVLNISLHRGHVLTELLDEFISINLTNSMNVVINIEMFLSNGQKELGLDAGGVFRDALSEFWNSFYEGCTNGTNFKVPLIREDYNKAKWEAVAKIIYVGWKQEKYFPIKLSPIFMQNCILNQIPPNEKLIENFLNIVSESEREVIKSGIENFDETDFDELLETLNNFDGRRTPNKENFKDIIYDIAHKEIIQKPKYIIDCWEPFLANVMDITTLNSLYEKCEPKPKNIMNILEVADNLNSEESTVFNFLKKFIRESEKSVLEKFLRFCTGADLITDRKISLQFKNCTGMQRTPVAHTCSGILELDLTYENFPEFRSELNSVLNSNIWVMDFA